jgi:hypothetical protein
MSASLDRGGVVERFVRWGAMAAGGRADPFGACLGRRARCRPPWTGARGAAVVGRAARLSRLLLWPGGGTRRADAVFRSRGGTIDRKRRVGSPRLRERPPPATRSRRTPGRFRAGGERRPRGHHEARRTQDTSARKRHPVPSGAPSPNRASQPVTTSAPLSPQWGRVLGTVGRVGVRRRRGVSVDGGHR